MSQQRFDKKNGSAIEKYRQNNQLNRWANETSEPISSDRSKDLEKLHKFCSFCLYKIFTRKTLLPSKNIGKRSTLHVTHESRAPISTW